MQELDLEQEKLVCKRVQLTHGHASNAVWTEGPHLYKVEGKYLLMVADSMVNPSLIAQRIEHHAFRVTAKLEFSTRKENEHTGLIVYRRSENHYQFLKKKKELVLIKSVNGIREEVASIPYEEKEVILMAEAKGLKVVFKFGPSLEDLRQLGPVQSMAVISDELSGGFNGPYVGMYATSNGIKSKSSAKFDWFEYQGTN